MGFRDQCGSGGEAQKLETDIERVTYTVQELVKKTGISRSKLYDLIAEGRLQTIRVGRRRLVLASSARQVFGF
jgi:excisionase family DNA binding protein